MNNQDASIEIKKIINQLNTAQSHAQTDGAATYSLIVNCILKLKQLQEKLEQS